MPTWMGSRLPSALDALVPRDHRGGLEAELGDDVQGGAGALGERVLPCQRRTDLRVGDVGTALGVSGDTDPRDSILVEQPGVEELHGVGELPEGAIEAASDEQRLIDAGIAGEARKALLQERAARDASGREVRDGVEPFAAQPACDRDGVGEARPGEKGDEDGRAGPQVDAVIRDLRRCRGGRLGGEARQEVDDRLFRGRRRTRVAGATCDLRRHDASPIDPRPARSAHGRLNPSTAGGRNPRAGCRRSPRRRSVPPGHGLTDGRERSRRLAHRRSARARIHTSAQSNEMTEAWKSPLSSLSHESTRKPFPDAAFHPLSTMVRLATQ